MKKKIIIASFVLIFGIGFTGVPFVFGQSATTTEFLPNIEMIDVQTQSQASLLLERFRGLIPDSAISSLGGKKSASSIPNTVVVNSSDVVFTKNLKAGDTDYEVLLLQKALNEDLDTIITTSGAGSPGSETTYFGQKTKLAVIKLQNKHYGEVLAPNGLSVGTGVFGPSTRAMMNNMQKNKSKMSVQTLATDVSTIIPSGPVSGLGEKVKIDYLDPSHGKDGTVVTIHGTGMTRTANSIIAGGDTFYGVSSSDGKTLSFTMKSPVSFDFSGMSFASSTLLKARFNEIKTKTFPSIKSPVCVLNDTGMSNCAFFTIDF
ncbi:MAG: hypothetical protein NTZ13_01250 [Candidatus Parcubacteria bacterium]|nr:hypothetical protein [Candidatus Parcubacteria bacterium]